MGTVSVEFVPTDEDQDGYTVSDGDCNDTDPLIHPNAAEVCDGMDNNCNNLLDEVGYVFGGFVSPLSSDGSSVFKAGRTIPVKIALTDCAGSSDPDAQVSISIGKISNAVEGTVELLDVEASGAANTGAYFRYDPVAEQYIYNLSTKGLYTGTYRLSAHTDNGDAYSVDFSLK
jgi:hypothetical protein